MLKTQSKQLVLRLLYKSGLLRLFVTSQRNKVTILMLHGVIDTNSPAAWKPLRSQLSTEQLTQVLNILASYYHFVSLSEAVEMLAGTRPLIPNSLALTFDDGYRNNLIFALPILHRFKTPATIFLCTGNVTEQTPFWFDRIDFAIQSMSDNAIARHDIPELIEIDFSNRETLKKTFMAFIQKTRRRNTTNNEIRLAIANLTDRLEQRSGHGLNEIFANDPWSGILNWDEIRENSALGVEFGSHGIDHPLLALTPLPLARQELVESKKMIEYYTDKPCIHLAYPNGSFNQEVISLARDYNYASAVTTCNGLNRQGDNVLALRRIAFPHAESPAEVIVAASGLSAQWQKSKEKYIHNSHSTGRKKIK